MLSQQYYAHILKNSFLLVLLFLGSCYSYEVGEIKAYSRTHKKPFEMGYVIHHNEITIVGKNKTLGAFKGKVLEIKHITRLEKNRYPQLSERLIKQKIRTSYARLQSDKKVTIECYIVQRSKRNFRKGGHGTCYASNGEIFDIILVR